MSHYAAGVHPALALGCCIGTTTGCLKGGTFFMESYQASVASCYLLFLALVCRGFSSSMLAMVRQHASFTSEADVLTAQAARLRLLISQGWFTWRLLTRALGADLNLSEMDFLKPLEDMVALFLPQLQHTFGQNMLQAAQEAGMRCDVVVLDGNAKNRRAVCAAALAGSSHSEHLPRTLRHTCTRTSAFRHAFCRWHCEGPMDGEDHLQVQGLGHCHLCCFLLAEKMCPCLRPQLQDVEIVHHTVVNDGQQLMVLLKRPWSLRERLGFRMHVFLQQFCRNMCDK